MFHHMLEYPDLRLDHAKALLKSPDHAKFRSDIVKLIKVGHYHERNDNILSYIYRPISCPLIEVTEKEIFNEKFGHLEYYPIVNTRAFSFKSSGNDTSQDESKEIQNVQFKETYHTFLMVMVHQKMDGVRYERDLKLKLVYYLLL